MLVIEAREQCDRVVPRSNRLDGEKRTEMPRVQQAFAGGGDACIEQPWVSAVGKQSHVKAPQSSPKMESAGLLRSVPE
jgi:hypothetical protein